MNESLRRSCQTLRCSSYFLYTKEIQYLRPLSELQISNYIVSSYNQGASGSFAAFGHQQWYKFHSSPYILFPEQSTKSKTVDTDRKQSTVATQQDSESSAEQCDQALHKYDKTLERYKNVSYPSNYPTMQRTAMGYVNTVQSAVKAVVSFTFTTIPQYCYKFLHALVTYRLKDYQALWKWIRHEGAETINHYRGGFQLLGTEIMISSGLIQKILRGEVLTRRERKQLTRTTADIFRVVPLLIMLVVPFLEFAAPVIIALFPNILPSTFQNNLSKEEATKKQLAVRLEYAKFLQDTMEEMAKDLKARGGGSAVDAKQLQTFIKKARSGETLTQDQILVMSRLFSDELTLENLDRVHLISMCQILGIGTFGTDTFLRTRLRVQLRNIRNDDMVIQQEGVKSLTDSELRSALKYRGMRAVFGEGGTEYMRAQLVRWLNLSLDKNVPSSLLLMSRALDLTSKKPKISTSKPTISTKGDEQDISTAITKDSDVQQEMASVAQILGTMPQEVITDIAMEHTDDRSVSDSKLAYIRKEQQHIKQEQQELQTLKEIQEQRMSRLRAKQDAESARREMAASTAAAAILTEAAAGLRAEKGGADIASDASVEEMETDILEKRQAKMQSILRALSLMASHSSVQMERQKLLDLITNEVTRLTQSMTQQGGSQLMFRNGALVSVRRTGASSTTGTDTSSTDTIPQYQQVLNDRVSAILHRIERDLDAADKQIGTNMKLIDKDGDGLISLDEMKQALGYLKDQVGEEEVLNIIQLFKKQQEGSEGEGGEQVSIQVQQLLEMAREQKGEGTKVKQ